MDKTNGEICTLAVTGHDKLSHHYVCCKKIYVHKKLIIKHECSENPFLSIYSNVLRGETPVFGARTMRVEMSFTQGEGFSMAQCLGEEYNSFCKDKRPSIPSMYLVVVKNFNQSLLCLPITPTYFFCLTDNVTLICKTK